MGKLKHFFEVSEGFHKRYLKYKQCLVVKQNKKHLVSKGLLVLWGNVL